MFIKYCIECGKEFKTDTNIQQICTPECKRNRERARNYKRYYRNKQIKQSNTKDGNAMLTNFQNEVDEYNRKHGTKYSYGMYEHLRSIGKI